MIDSQHSRFRRREGIIAQEAHGRTVLLRLSDGHYYTVDDVAAEVWNRCDGETTIDEIVNAVCARYDAGPETVSADVTEFVKELVAEGLLERVA